MSGALEHYRHSAVGEELQDILDEFVGAEMLTEEQREVILAQFDIAISNELSKVKSKATIKGPLHHYRNHDDIWTFVLSNVHVKIDDVDETTTGKAKILSVARR